MLKSTAKYLHSLFYAGEFAIFEQLDSYQVPNTVTENKEEYENAIKWLNEFNDYVSSEDDIEFREEDITNHLSEWKKISSTFEKMSTIPEFSNIAPVLNQYKNAINTFSSTKLLGKKVWSTEKVNYNDMGITEAGEELMFFEEGKEKYFEAYNELKSTKPIDTEAFSKSTKKDIDEAFNRLVALKSKDSKVKELINKYKSLSDDIKAKKTTFAESFDALSDIAGDAMNYVNGVFGPTKNAAEIENTRRVMMSISSLTGFAADCLADFKKSNESLTDAKEKMNNVLGKTLLYDNPFAEDDKTQTISEIICLAEGKDIDYPVEEVDSLQERGTKLLADGLNVNGAGKLYKDTMVKALNNLRTKINDKMSEIYNLPTEEVPKAKKEFMDKYSNVIGFFRTTGDLFKPTEIEDMPAYNIFTASLDILDRSEARMESPYFNNKIREYLGAYPGGANKAVDVLKKAGMMCKNRDCSLLSNTIAFAKFKHPEMKLEDIAKNNELIKQSALDFVEFAKQNPLYDENDAIIKDEIVRTASLKNWAAYHESAYHILDDVKVKSYKGKESLNKDVLENELYSILAVDISQDEETLRKVPEFKKTYLSFFENHSVLAERLSNAQCYYNSLAVIQTGTNKLYDKVNARIMTDYLGAKYEGQDIATIGGDEMNAVFYQGTSAMLAAQIAQYSELHNITPDKLIEYANGGENPFPEDALSKMLTDSFTMGKEMSMEILKNDHSLHSVWYDTYTDEQLALKKKMDAEMEAKKIVDTSKLIVEQANDNLERLEEIDDRIEEFADNLLDNAKDSKHKSDLFENVVKASGQIKEDLESGDSEISAAHQGEFYKAANEYIEARKDSKRPEVIARVGMVQNMLDKFKEREKNQTVMHALQYSEILKTGEEPFVNVDEMELPHVKDVAMLGEMILISGGIDPKDLPSIANDDPRKLRAYAGAARILGDRDANRKIIADISRNYTDIMYEKEKDVLSLFNQSGTNIKDADTRTYLEYSDRLKTGCADLINSFDLNVSDCNKGYSQGLPFNMAERMVVRARRISTPDAFEKAREDGIHDKKEIHQLDKKSIMALNNACMSINTRADSILANANMYALFTNDKLTISDLVYKNKECGSVLKNYVEFAKANPVVQTSENHARIPDEKQYKASVKAHAEYYRKWYEFNDNFVIGNVADPEERRARIHEYEFMRSSLINCSQNEQTIRNHAGADYYEAFGGRQYYEEITERAAGYQSIIKCITTIDNPSAATYVRTANAVYIDLVKDDINGKKLSQIGTGMTASAFSEAFTMLLSTRFQEVPESKLRDYLENGKPFMEPEKLQNMINEIKEQSIQMAKESVADEKNRMDTKLKKFLEENHKADFEKNTVNLQNTINRANERYNYLNEAVKRLEETMCKGIVYHNPQTGKDELINDRARVQELFTEHKGKPLSEHVREGCTGTFYLSYMLSKGLTMEEFVDFAENKDPEKYKNALAKINANRQGIFDMVVNEDYEAIADYYADYSRVVVANAKNVSNMNSMQDIERDMDNLYVYANTQSTLLQTLRLGTGRGTEPEVEKLIGNINKKLAKDNINFETVQGLGLTGHNICQNVQDAKIKHDGKKLGFIDAGKAVASARFMGQMVNSDKENGAGIADRNLSYTSANFNALQIMGSVGANKSNGMAYQNLIADALGDTSAMNMAEFIIDPVDGEFDPEEFNPEHLEEVYALTRDEFMKELSGKDETEAPYNKFEIARYFDKYDSFIPEKDRETVANIRSGKSYDGFEALNPTLKKMLTCEYAYKNGLLLSSKGDIFFDRLAKDSIEQGRNLLANPLLIHASDYKFNDKVVENSFRARTRFAQLTPEELKTAIEKHSFALSDIEETLSGFYPDGLNTTYKRVRDNDGERLEPLFEKGREYTREEANEIIGNALSETGEVFVHTGRSSYPMRFSGNLAVVHNDNTYTDKGKFGLTREQVKELVDNGTINPFRPSESVETKEEKEERIAFENMSPEEKDAYITRVSSLSSLLKPHEVEYMYQNMDKFFSEEDIQAIHDYDEKGIVPDFNKVLSDTSIFLRSRFFNERNLLKKNMPELEDETINHVMAVFHEGEDLSRNRFYKDAVENGRFDVVKRKDAKEFIDEAAKNYKSASSEYKKMVESVKEISKSGSKERNMLKVLNDLMFSSGAHFTNPETGEEIPFNGKAEYDRIGGKLFDSKPFSEAFGRNSMSHVKMFLLGSGVTIQELVSIKNNPDSAEAKLAKEHIKGLSQDYADFVSKGDTKKIADVYMNYINTFNKNCDFLKECKDIGHLAKHADELLLFADGHSVFSQTLKYDNGMSPKSNELVKELDSRFARYGSDYEHATGMVYGTSITVIQQMFGLSQKKYADFYDEDLSNRTMDEALRMVGSARYIADVIENNDVSLERSKDLPLVSSTGNMIVQNIDSVRPSEGFRETKVYGEIISFINGKEDGLDLSHDYSNLDRNQKDRISEDIRFTAKEKLLKSKRSKEKDPQILEQINADIKALSDRKEAELPKDLSTSAYIDYEKYESLNSEDIEKASQTVQNELAKPGIPDKYVIDRVVPAPGKTDVLSQKLRRELDGSDDDLIYEFQNKSNEAKKLIMGKFFKDHYGEIMDKPQLFAKRMADMLSEMQGEEREAQEYFLGKFIEEGQKDPAFGERFKQIDAATFGRYTIKAAKKDLEKCGLEGRKSYAFEDLLRGTEKWLKGNDKRDGVSYPYDYNELTMTCDAYIDKHYGDSPDSVGGRRRDVALRLKQSIENTLSFGEKSQVPYSPVTSFNKSMGRIRTGRNNSPEFEAVLESLDNMKIGYSGEISFVGSQDKRTYRALLENLRDASHNYLVAKGNPKRGTELGQKRYDLVKKMFEYSKNYIDKSDMEEVKAFSKHMHGGALSRDTHMLNRSRGDNEIALKALVTHMYATVNSGKGSRYEQNLMPESEWENYYEAARKTVEDYKLGKNPEPLKEIISLYKETIGNKYEKIITGELDFDKAFQNVQDKDKFVETVNEYNNMLFKFEDAVPDMKVPDERFENIQPTYKELDEMNKSSKKMSENQKKYEQELAEFERNKAEEAKHLAEAKKAEAEAKKQQELEAKTAEERRKALVEKASKGMAPVSEVPEEEEVDHDFKPTKLGYIPEVSEEKEADFEPTKLGYIPEASEEEEMDEPEVKVPNKAEKERFSLDKLLGDDKENVDKTKVQGSKQSQGKDIKSK